MTIIKGLWICNFGTTSAGLFTVLGPHSPRGFAVDYDCEGTYGFGSFFWGINGKLIKSYFASRNPRDY